IHSTAAIFQRSCKYTPGCLGTSQGPESFNVYSLIFEPFTIISQGFWMLFKLINQILNLSRLGLIFQGSHSAGSLHTQFFRCVFGQCLSQSSIARMPLEQALNLSCHMMSVKCIKSPVTEILTTSSDPSGSVSIDNQLMYCRVIIIGVR